MVLVQTQAGCMEHHMGLARDAEGQHDAVVFLRWHKAVVVNAKASTKVAQIY